MDEDLKGIVSNIRACIRSSTGPTLLRNLSRDYETLVGDQIPFRQYNYATLEDFLRSLPSLRVSGSGGHAMVEASSSDASNHITALISKQKSTSKKSAPFPPRRSYPPSFPFRGRGGSRGRGRGSYPSRPYAPRDYSTRDYTDRDQPSRENTGHHSRDYPSRDYTDRDQPSRENTGHHSRDYPSRDYTARDHQPRDYNDPHSREYPSRDQSARDYPAGNHSRDYSGGDRDYSHTNSAPKRYSPNFHNRPDTAQPGGPITVRVVGDDKRQVSWKSELPPRLQKLRNQNANIQQDAVSQQDAGSQQHSDTQQNTDIPPASSISPRSQMVLEIHCLGSSFANDLVAYLQTDKSISSHLKVSRFLYFPGAKINEVELLIMKDKVDLNAKVPLLIILGENDVLLTTEKIKEIKKHYISLIFHLRQLCPGIQLILVHLPICICSYKNQNYLERMKSFNEFLSHGLQNHSNEIFVFNPQKVLNKFEFFNCENNQIKSLSQVGCHVNERGYSTLVRSLITQLQQMVLEIHCLGSSFANDLVAYLQTDKSISSHLKVSRFLYFPGAKINEVELLIMKDKVDLNAKIPLLIMLGENDVLLTTEKTKEIKKHYISLIFHLRQLCPGIQLILVHLPICICSYKNQNYLERMKSFNEFLSHGLQNHSNEIYVFNLQKVLDKFEFFNCENNQIKSLSQVGCHVNERGYSTLVRSLITQLQQGFDMSLFLDRSTSASNSASIISPLGPSQLIAAGLAKQRAEKAKLQQQYCGTSDFLLQPSSQQTNDLVGDFARLSHQDSDAVALGNLRTSLNGHSQIPEDPSALLPHLEDLLPEPDDDIMPNNTLILQSYCLSRGWPPPTYSVHQQKCPDTHQNLYFASVKVNGGGANTFQVSTLPYEHVNVNVVKGYAANKALKKIVAEESKKVKADKIISSDSNIICSRISDIVAGATTGLFIKSVEDEYISRHNELLPDDWLQTVRSWPTLSVESTVNSTIIVPRELSTEVQPVSELVQFDPTVAPPPLPLEALGDADGTEDVYITHATSVNNVWFRVIGKDYSDEYEVLLANMDLYYNGAGSQELALTLEVDQYYAARGFDTWFRVCVTEVDDDSQTVVAWLVDHGDNERFAFGSLYRLAPQFCQLPRQAVLCTLEGLECFIDDELANEIVSTSELLIGQSLIAKISYKDKESGFVKATLYDTSGDDDIVVNQQLKDEIIEKSKPAEQLKDEIIEKAKPALPAEGCAIEVAIGDVSKKGEVYIMIDNPMLDRIAEILESLGPDKISEHKLTSFKHISLNKMYLAKYSKDDTWYRAVVTTTPSVQHNKIPVRFVDYGNTESVSISDIADLENLPPILKKLPVQAVKVALHNLPLDTLTNPEVARLHSLLLDEDKVVLIKTISLKVDPPIVEIFTKEAENGALVSVNSTIELQRKLLNSFSHEKRKNSLAGSDANCNLSTKDQDHFVLKCPDFSDSEFQGILVVLAAHPGNFIFQPVKYAKDLKKLRGQMAAYYNAGALPELSADRVVKNKLFAARYVDDLWYRVVVTDSPMGNRVPVRLCDFGDVTCVSISSLRELALEFHIYPFMAVKGKLAGVVPIHRDWSVEDCIRFQNLVINQILAGIVVNIQTNEENPMEMLVTLTLVDTSSDQDQDIAGILLREQRAVRES